MSSKKTLVIAAICFPPCLIGPAILMGNLFRHFPQGSYHVLMGRLDHQWLPQDIGSMLPAQYTFTRYPSCEFSGSIFRCIRTLLRDFYTMLEIMWKGLWIIRKEDINRIFVVTDHFVELPALLIHWITGIKIVLWMPDLYYHYDAKSISKIEKLLLKFFEPRILKWGDKVLVASSATKDYYEKKYGNELIELRHTVELKRYNELQNEQQKDDGITILYTGIITQSHYDSILDLINVVEKLRDINIKLLLVTTTNFDKLKQLGLKGNRVFYNVANREEIPKLQQAADILFLPLAFKYYSDLNVKTASPSKLPEYLAAGRPILVYAPSQSYYVKYAREHEFAYIVDKNDPDLLSQAILELYNDRSLRQRLVANAQRTVKKYHDSVKVSEKLQTMLGAI